MNNQFFDSKSIKLLIAGDESVFTFAYDLYSAKVYRLAFKFLKDKQQSEKVVHETFIKLWLGREQLDPSGNPWLYLFVIAMRLSINALRQNVSLVRLSENELPIAANMHSENEEEVLVHETHGGGSAGALRTK